MNAKQTKLMQLLDFAILIYVICNCMVLYKNMLKNRVLMKLVSYCYILKSFRVQSSLFLLDTLSVEQYCMRNKENTKDHPPYHHSVHQSNVEISDWLSIRQGPLTPPSHTCTSFIADCHVSLVI